MSLTLVEGQKYSTTTLEKGMVELLVKDSPILNRLRFRDLVGNSLTYNRETTEPTATFYSVGDTWTESTGTMTQYTTSLTNLGGDADVDNFIKSALSNVNDVFQMTLERKTKAVRKKFLDTFYYGDVSTDAKAFNGAHLLIADATYNTVHAGSGTGSALSIDKLRQSIDMIKGAKGQLITSSKPMRRGVSKYLDSIGSAFPADRDAFGRMVRYFEDIPWDVDDHIVDVETAASGAYSASSGGANTSIFIFNFEDQGMQGLQRGGLKTKVFDDLETKNASRVRIIWYCGLMMESLIHCAKVDGIVSAGTVVA